MTKNEILALIIPIYKKLQEYITQGSTQLLPTEQQTLIQIGKELQPNYPFNFSCSSCAGEIVRLVYAYYEREKIPLINLTVKRIDFNSGCTIGTLSIDNTYFCDTLENIIRTKKVPGKTAIPYGTYQVQLYFSPDHKKILPLLLNVEGYAGIEIHGGNTSADTKGCILVAYNTDDKTEIWESASQDLVNKLTGAEKIMITIEKD